MAVPEAFRRNAWILWWGFVSITTGVGQTVTLAGSLAYAMPAYPFFVFWATAIPFTIVFYLVLWGFQIFTKEITPEVKQTPQKIWFLMGFLTMLNGVGLLFSGPHVTGPLQALLGPTVVIIPMCMVCAVIYLRTRYGKGQLLGVFIIVGGIFIAIYPSLFGTGAQQTSSGGSIWWDLLFVLGSLPSAMLYVYQEKALNNMPIHMAHLMAWSTFWQLLCILTLGAALSMIPGFGDTTPSQFLQHQADAYTCFAKGINPPSCPQCVCEDAMAYICIFIFMYITTNYSSLGLVKHASATFAFIVSTVVTPLSAITFSIKPLMGGFYTPLSTVNIISLVVLMVGVTVYRYFDSKAKKNTEEYHPLTGESINDEDGGDKGPRTAYPTLGFATWSVASQRAVRSESIRLSESRRSANFMTT